MIDRDLDIEHALNNENQETQQLRLRISREDQILSLNGSVISETTYGPTVPLFPRRQPSGRIDIVKTGNTVRTIAAGVKEYTLLLSPLLFNLAEPILVITNGKVSYSGRVKPQLSTLFRWAAADRDRTALYGAELHIKVV